MPLADTHTRLVVQVPGCRVDLNVSKDMHITELCASIRNHLAHVVFKGDEQYAEQRDFLLKPYAQWQLANPVGVHYPGDKLLSDVGIYDGSVVMLVDSPQRENYSPLIDDTAESLAMLQRQNFGEWVNDNGRTLSAVLAPLAAALVALVTGHAVAIHALGTTGQYVAAGLMLFVGLGLLIGGALARSSLAQDPVAPASLNSVTAGGLMAGYIMVAGAGLLTVPGKMGQLNLVLAGAVMFACAAIVAAVLRFPESLNFATMGVGALTAIGSGIGASVHASGQAMAYGLAAGAVILFLVAPRLSLVVGRVKLPRIPSRGEPFTSDDDEDLSSFKVGTRPTVIASIINQKQRAMTAHGCLVGIIWGALALLVACALYAGQSLQHNPLLGFIFFGALSVGIAFRGKRTPEAAVQRVWLIAAFVIPSLFVCSVASTGRDTTLVMGAIALIAVGVAAAGYVTVQNTYINSPVIQRVLEIIEWLCYTTLVPCLVFLLSLYGTVRAR